jgi:hypothetical protein
MAINWGDLGAGALGGAGTGATIGTSFVPGWGTAVGAGVGGLAGILAALFGGGGKEGGPERLTAANEQEQSILDFLLQNGMGQLQDPQKGFKPLEDYARTQFANHTIPSLAERFTSFAGGNNALSSPSFASQLGQAGAGLESSLAALGSQYGQQNQQNALQQLNTGLKPAFNTDYKATQHGTGTNILASLLQSQAIPKLIENGPELYKQYKANKMAPKQAKG